jgi:transcriptional regulator with XRE-family HTH domain
MAINIGSAINLCRRQKKLTQAELALRANLSESYLSLIERGRRDPPLSSLQAIARGLEIPLSLLLFLAADASELESLPTDVQDKLSSAVYKLLKASASDQQSSLL